MPDQLFNVAVDTKTYWSQLFKSNTITRIARDHRLKIFSDHITDQSLEQAQ